VYGYTAVGRVIFLYPADGICVMMHLLKSPATDQQRMEMLSTNQLYIKVAVDIYNKILAGGGELHADCEWLLLEEGSLSDNIWGADWYPHNHSIEFESMINLKPRQNRSMRILDQAVRSRVVEVVRHLLEPI
jgi:Protein of unknown function (DUF5674)